MTHATRYLDVSEAPGPLLSAIFCKSACPYTGYPCGPTVAAVVPDGTSRMTISSGSRTFFLGIFSESKETIHMSPAVDFPSCLLGQIVVLFCFVF